MEIASLAISIHYLRLVIRINRSRADLIKDYSIQSSFYRAENAEINLGKSRRFNQYRNEQ